MYLEKKSIGNLTGKLIFTPLYLTVLISPIIQVLPAIASPTKVIAQPSQINSPANSDNATEKIKADQLVAEGETLLKTSDDFFYTLSKYVDALIIYRKIGDQTAEEVTRKRFEQILAENAGTMNRKRDSIYQSRDEFLKNLTIIPASNQTAITLEKLVSSQLGFAIYNSTAESLNQTKAKEFENIVNSFSLFLDSQITNPTDQLEPLPNNIKIYLENNQKTLEQIRELLGKGQPLQWQFNPTWRLDEEPPNLFGVVNLQKILLLEAIAQYQKGNQQNMLANLDTSWKISQSLQNNPLLFSQLINIIGIKYQAGLFRKLGNLPVSWQKQLLAHDYRQSMMIALYTENHGVFTSLEQIQPEVFADMMGEEAVQFLVDAGWQQWSLESRRNFILWIAINLNEYGTKTYNKLPQQNVCQLKMADFLQAQGIRPRELVFLQSFARQWQKAGQAMINLELTANVLELLANQANGQDLPNTVVPSNICQGTNWVYQQKPSEMTIEINPQPSEWPGQHTLPLKFIGKFPPK